MVSMLPMANKLIFILYLMAPSLIFGGSSPAKKKKFTVVTTFTIIADMARNVVGDRAIVHSITKPGAEIHGYEPTPKDIVKAQEADLILWNGLGLERWFKRFFSHLKNVPEAIVSQGVSPLSISEGAYMGKPNPHAWMSLENGKIYVRNILKAVKKQDPTNGEFYEKNAQAYIKKIGGLREDFRKKFQKIPRAKRVLVTSEGAFTYLARDFSMGELYLWPINAERQGTPKQIKKVIDQVREKSIPVIFSESTVSDRPAKQVASETDAKYGGVLYVDSLSESDGVVPTYLDLIRVTIETISQGFEK